MATKFTDNDGAVRAVFTDADSDASVASHVRMGRLLGGKAVAQIATIGDDVTGSNDGTNFAVIATADATNDIVTIDPVPLFISVPADNAGAVIVVGWQDR